MNPAKFALQIAAASFSFEASSIFTYLPHAASASRSRSSSYSSSSSSSSSTSSSSSSPRLFPRVWCTFRIFSPRRPLLVCATDKSERRNVELARYGRCRNRVEKCMRNCRMCAKCSLLGR